MSNDQAPSAPDRIVVGVDGSQSSLQALLWARFLAHTTGSTVEAVTVWQPSVTYGWPGDGGAGIAGDWNPVADAHKILDDALDAVFGSQRPPGLDTTVLEGNAAKVLLNRSSGARMLVVGSRGHGGVVGLLFGSVSAACAEHAGCTVVVVHGAPPPPPS